MEKRYLNRWIYAGVGVAVLLLAGLIYAWSVLVQPIAQEFTGASQGELSLTFTICMIFFCLGGFVGGLLSKKVDVRMNVWAAALMFPVGFFIASKASAVGGLCLGYGVLAGFASGLAYNAVMSTMSGWFPDKQGLISGILLMGFGLSSFIVGKLYDAYTPAGIGGWRTSFLFMGVLLAVVLVVCGFFFVRPPKGYRPAGLVDAEGAASKDAGEPAEAVVDMAAGQMLRQSSFWLFFVWAVLLSAAGLAVIAQGAGVVGQVTDGALDGGTTATIVGLISIFNGIGRVLFGGLFDKLGQRKTMLMVDGAFLISVLVVIAALMTKSLPILVASFVCCGLSYGGITPTNSAFINSFYGAKNYPVNFSIINLNLIVASFGGTAAGVLFDMTGSYLTTFLALVVAIVVGTLCTLAIKRPRVV